MVRYSRSGTPLHDMGVACLATSRPNGLVNARCLDCPRSNLPVSARNRLPFSGKRDCEARDNSAKTRRCPSLVSAETRSRAAEPANSRLFARRQEISANARMRGGPGRSSSGEQRQRLTARCGRFGPIDGKRNFRRCPHQPTPRHAGSDPTWGDLILDRPTNLRGEDRRGPRASPLDAKPLLAST
jgi:hypothetical protein